MRIRFTVGQLVTTIVGLAVVGLAWFYLAPPMLGGSTSYVVTDGASMQPRFHAGDLALVRGGSRSSYHVGEIVAYHSEMLHTLVLHRIVGIGGGRYLFKGDHNSFIDPERPVRSELAGALWLHIPKAGRALNWLHRPSHSAVVSGLLVLFALGGGGLGIRRRRRRRSDTATATRRERAPTVASPVASEAARTVLTLAALATLLFGFLALIGYRHSTMRTVETPGAYVHHGTYAYSASTTPSAIYPSGAVVTGQPVFLRLVRRLRLDFAYRFASSLPHSVAGTVRLDATLASSAGWRKHLVAGTPLPFRGDGRLLTIRLDLAAIEKTIAGYYKLTGAPGDTFTLALVPTVQVHGLVSGRAIRSSFAPAPLDFAVGQYSLLTAQGRGGRSAAAFHPSSAGVIEEAVPRSIALPGARARVTTLRSLGSIGTLAAILVALAAAAALALARRGDELTRIRRTYGSALVAVTSPPVIPNGGYVDVPSFESLAYLAESYSRLILHHDDLGTHSFYLDDDSSVYRYRLTSAEVAAAAPGVPSSR